MTKKENKDNKMFLLFMLLAIAFGVIYLFWGQHNSAQTLFDLGFLRYRAEEQLNSVETWTVPIADSGDYAQMKEAAAAWASEQETVAGSYEAVSAAQHWGDSLKLTLDYTLYGPETGKTVILLHGFCDSPADSLCWAQFWQEQGYRVLIPVQRGYADPGDTNYTPTTFGAYEQFDLYDLILTLGLEDEEVIIHGKGGGAAAAILMAANESLAGAALDGIVAESVYDNMGQTERALVKQLFNLGDNFVGRFLREQIVKKLGFDADSVDICAAAANMSVPTLFLCSAGDEFLGAQRTEAVSNACAAPNTLKHLQGSYRTLWLRDGEAYREAISDLIR